MQAEHRRLILLGGIFAPGPPLLVGAIVDSKWCACAGYSHIDYEIPFMITPSHDGLEANEVVGGVRVLCGGGRKGAF